MKLNLQLLRPLFAIIFFIGSIIACKDESESIEKKEMVDLGNKTTLSVNEARKHFETTYSNPNFKKSDHDHSNEHKTLKWDIAYHKSITYGESVIIPMDFAGLVIQQDEEHVTDYSNLNYTMMYKDAEGVIKTEWVTLLPDQIWYDSDRSKYVGKILVRDWNGIASKIYLFTSDGKSTGYDVTDQVSQTKSAKVTSNAFSFDICTKVRRPELCTCLDKAKCDYCNVCAPETCITLTTTPENPNTPSVPSNPSNPGNGTGSNGNNGSGGSGSASSGGNYVPQCNASIPPGTQVSPNQLPACPSVSSK